MDRYHARADACLLRERRHDIGAVPSTRRAGHGTLLAHLADHPVVRIRIPVTEPVARAVGRIVYGPDGVKDAVIADARRQSCLEAVIGAPLLRFLESYCSRMITRSAPPVRPGVVTAVSKSFSSGVIADEQHNQTGNQNPARDCNQIAKPEKIDDGSEQRKAGGEQVVTGHKPTPQGDSE